MDGAGNVFVVGRFNGTLDLGGGPLVSAGKTDMFVAKLDPAGGHLWSRSIGSPSSDDGLTIAVDAAGNAVATGYTSGTVDLGGGPVTCEFAVKLDPAGNQLWGKQLAVGCPLISGTAFNGAGQVIVTGGFSGTIDFGGGTLTSAGAHDVFVLALDAAGNHLWSKRFGDVQDQLQSRGCRQRPWSCRPLRR